MKSHSGGQHICEGRQKSGEPCTMINTMRCLEGWYCRHHRRGKTVAHSGDLDQPMPSTKFTTKADAERFTQWVLTQGARGHINAAQTNALMKAVSTWNKIQERMEQQLLDEFKALCHRAASEYAKLREIAASEEGTD